MGSGRRVCFALLLLLTCAGATGCQRGASRPPIGVSTPGTTLPTASATLERIVVAPDGRGFVTAVTREPFHPWGMDLGFERGLMEEYWDTDWAALASDFREMAQLGASVVRVHLQFGAFMSAPDQPNR